LPFQIIVTPIKTKICILLFDFENIRELNLDLPPQSKLFSQDGTSWIASTTRLQGQPHSSISTFPVRCISFYVSYRAKTNSLVAVTTFSRP
jgi:hypothetical protein